MKLFDVVAKPDGTWLHLNGPVCSGCIRLESILYADIISHALAEVREILIQEQKDAKSRETNS